MHARYYSPHLGRFMSVDPRERYKPTKLPQRWNRYAYAIGNPMKFVDPNGEDLKLVFDFRGSGIPAKQQTQVVVGIRRRFANAGVRNVQLFRQGGSTRPRVSKATDRVVVVRFTDKNLKEGRIVFGKNKPPSNVVVVSTAHAPEDEQARTNFLINVGSHEAGHGTRALPQYDNDQFPQGSMLNPTGAEAGSVMEQGVDAETLGAEVREFSEEDAEDLREGLNDPEPE